MCECVSVCYTGGGTFFEEMLGGDLQPEAPTQRNFLSGVKGGDEEKKKVEEVKQERGGNKRGRRKRGGKDIS